MDRAHGQGHLVRARDHGEHGGVGLREPRAQNQLARPLRRGRRAPQQDSRRRRPADDRAADETAAGRVRAGRSGVAGGHRPRRAAAADARLEPAVPGPARRDSDHPARARVLLRPQPERRGGEQVDENPWADATRKRPEQAADPGRQDRFVAHRAETGHALPGAPGPCEIVVHQVPKRTAPARSGARRGNRPRGVGKRSSDGVRVGTTAGHGAVSRRSEGVSESADAGGPTRKCAGTRSGSEDLRQLFCVDVYSGEHAGVDFDRDDLGALRLAEVPKSRPHLRIGEAGHQHLSGFGGQPGPLQSHGLHREHRMHWGMGVHAAATCVGAGVAGGDVRRASGSVRGGLHGRGGEGLYARGRWLGSVSDQNGSGLLQRVARNAGEVPLQRRLRRRGAAPTRIQVPKNPTAKKERIQLRHGHGGMKMHLHLLHTVNYLLVVSSSSSSSCSY
mmetsp:Transcript_24431/g.61409  ORF Transcript_24431/g.61409 Transcript_24431/m.61409 type:complete len:447 (-) Transcript_24431:313-1653(-)